MTSPAAGAAPFSWNLIADVQQMWTYPFMVNAFRAGTIVALVAGLIGWFMVLRRQSFAGHTLSLVAFPGASAAVLLGLSATVGFFAFAVAAALVIAAAPGGAARSTGRYSEESAVIGTVQACALACGFLFVALYKGFLTGLNSLLFGSFLGITTDQILTLAAAGGLALAVLAAIGRPLLFASVDPDVAAARGLPVRGLGAAFLVLLGVAAAEASQITGSLLVFALLVMPAAAAQRLTPRPVLSLALTAVIGMAATWAGLTLAYFTPYPVGFYTTTVAFGIYLVATALGGKKVRRQHARAAVA